MPNITVNKITIILEDDDIYNMWDILSFYKDYCAEHPERTDATSNGKKELADKIIEVCKNWKGNMNWYEK